jgi:flagellar biosynthesis/type III secretory pathway protein FliH
MAIKPYPAKVFESKTLQGVEELDQLDEARGVTGDEFLESAWSKGYSSKPAPDLTRQAAMNEQSRSDAAKQALADARDEQQAILAQRKQELEHVRSLTKTLNSNLLVADEACRAALIDFVFDIAEKVVRHELSYQRASLESALADALEAAAPLGVDVQIHLCASDADYLEPLLSEQGVEASVIVDENLCVGDIVVECPNGGVDARVHERIERVKTALLKHAEL